MSSDTGRLYSLKALIYDALAQLRAEFPVECFVIWDAARISGQGDYLRGADDQYPLRPADCRVQKERVWRKLKPLAPGAKMTFTGEPLMDVLTTVNDESG